MEAKKRWTKELVQVSKLPIHVKSLYSRTHDENGDLLPNGALWYDATVVHRFHPYYANEVLEVYGPERDRAVIQVYQDLKAKYKNVENLANVVQTGKLFGVPNVIVSSTENLEKAYKSTPLKTRQVVLNEMNHTRSMKEYKAEKAKETVVLDKNGNPFPLQKLSSYEVVAERNKAWDKEKIQEAVQKSDSEKFQGLQKDDPNHEIISEKINHRNGIFPKASFLKRMTNRIKSLFTEPAQAQEPTYELSQPVASATISVALPPYTAIDRVQEAFHQEMEEFSKGVAIKLEETKEELRKKPWPDIRKRQEQERANERTRMRRKMRNRREEPPFEL